MCQYLKYIWFKDEMLEMKWRNDFVNITPMLENHKHFSAGEMCHIKIAYKSKQKKKS